MVRGRMIWKTDAHRSCARMDQRWGTNPIGASLPLLRAMDRQHQKALSVNLGHVLGKLAAALTPEPKRHRALSVRSRL